MAPRSGGTRQRMTDSAVSLLRERGANGVTVDAVLAHSGAPRGSVYHHFPGGRDEIVLTAAREAGDFIDALIADLLDPAHLGASIDTFVRFWKDVVVDSDYAAGCPIVALAVDHRADLPAAAELVAGIFTRWQRRLEEALVAGGRSPEDARRLATLTLAATEGAIILTRAHRDTGPLDDVGATLHQLITADPTTGGNP